MPPRQYLWTDSKEIAGVKGPLPRKKTPEYNQIKKKHDELNKPYNDFIKNENMLKQMKKIEKKKEKEDEKAERALQQEMIEESKPPNVKEMVADIENKEKGVAKSMKKTEKADNQVKKINEKVEKIDKELKEKDKKKKIEQAKPTDSEILKMNLSTNKDKNEMLLTKLKKEKEAINKKEKEKKEEDKIIKLNTTTNLKINKEQEDEIRSNITQLLKMTPDDAKRDLQTNPVLNSQFYTEFILDKKNKAQVGRINKALSARPSKSDSTTSVEKQKFDISNIGKILDKVEDGSMRDIDKTVVKGALDKLYIKGKITETEFNDFSDKIQIKSNKTITESGTKKFYKIKPKPQIKLIRRLI